MKHSLLSARRHWPIVTLLLASLAAGLPQLLARPDPPAADRLMDPTKPGNQLGHLFAPDATPAPPTASESAFKNFKKGPATFTEFCQQHSLTGKPVGQERFLIEVLAADAPSNLPIVSGPAEPAATMLATGGLLRQTVFVNTQAQTENVLSIDRQGDGSKLPEPAWEGQRLFTSLEQTNVGYSVTFTLAESQVIGWMNASAAKPGSPILAQLEINDQISIQPNGQWVALDGGFRETAGNDGSTAKQHTVVYLRLTKLN